MTKHPNNRRVAFPADINDPALSLDDVELELGDLVDDIEYRYGYDTAERVRELYGYCAYKIPHTMSPAQILEEARTAYDRITR